jgi:hypothetical protein
MLAAVVGAIGLIVLFLDERRRFRGDLSGDSPQQRLFKWLGQHIRRPSGRSPGRWWTALAIFGFATVAVLFSGLKIELLCIRIIESSPFYHYYCKPEGVPKLPGQLKPAGRRNRYGTPPSIVAGTPQSPPTDVDNPTSPDTTFRGASTAPISTAEPILSSSAASEGERVLKAQQQTSERLTPPAPVVKTVHDQAWHDALSWIGRVMVPVAYLLPLMWLWLFALAWLGSTSERDFTSLLYATCAVVVPYCVLALAMVLELPRVAEQGGIHAVGIIASIMILYFLTALAGFLFMEMPEFRERMRHLLEDRLPWYAHFTALSTPRYGEPAPGRRVTSLLAKWSDVYNLGKNADDLASENDRSADADRERFSKICVGTLLDSYLGEELDDISGQLNRDHVPDALWPPGYENGDKGVAFMATNLSYFQELLKRLVQKLAVPLDDRKFCMAVITNVLPSQWWNWPREDGVWGHYEPVAEYRDTLIGAGQYTWVFRYVLVSNETYRGRSQQIPLLFTQEEADTQKNWHCLRANATLALHSSKPVKPDLGQTFLMDELVLPSGRDHSYYMGDRIAPPLNYTAPAVHEVFSEQMHRSKVGWTWILPTSRERFEAPRDGSDPTKIGFGGCADLMFMGNCAADVQDAWSDGADVRWGVALMSSLSASSKTMFLTTVYDPERIDRIWSGARTAVANAKSEVNAPGFPLKVE